MTRVLYVDRGSPTRLRILHGLVSAGFQVDVIGNVHDIKRMARGHSYDCILARCLAINQTDVPAFCSYLRDSSNVVIVLMDIVNTLLEGCLFDCGVDDVIVCERVVPDLVAKRIMARLRWPNGRQLSTAQIRLDELVVDFARHIVMREGVEHQLSGLLTDLLHYLIHNAGRVISRQELRESPIWADSICTGPEDGGKTFDMHISRLRRLIEKDPSKPKLIKSVRGIGWKLTVQPTWNHCNLRLPEGTHPHVLNERAYVKKREWR